MASRHLKQDRTWPPSPRLSEHRVQEAQQQRHVWSAGRQQQHRTAQLVVVRLHPKSRCQRVRSGAASLVQQHCSGHGAHETPLRMYQSTEAPFCCFVFGLVGAAQAHALRAGAAAAHGRDDQHLDRGLLAAEVQTSCCPHCCCSHHHPRPSSDLKRCRPRCARCSDFG